MAKNNRNTTYEKKKEKEQGNDNGHNKVEQKITEAITCI